MGKRTRRREPCPKNNRTSVSSMTWGAIRRSLGNNEKKSQKKPKGMRSRSFAPRAMANYENSLRRMGVSEEDSITDKSFFDVPTGTSPRSMPAGVSPHRTPQSERKPVSSRSQGVAGGVVRAEKVHDMHSAPPVTPSRSRNNMSSSRRESGFTLSSREERKPTMKPVRHDDDGDGDFLPDWIEAGTDNSDRHAVGFNFLSKVFGTGQTNIHTKRTRRPYFTYWVTVVQVIIYIIAVAWYGFAPVGLGSKQTTDDILMTSLLIEEVHKTELRNMWIGPSRDDLIHLGAKYSLCMRPDETVKKHLDEDKALEKDTACCVYNDGSGCVQTSADNCNAILNTWFKYTASNPGFNGILSGSVCGQDPEYCLEPASTGAHVWKDDITKWPVCTKSANMTGLSSTQNIHMTCELSGRPCCVGIQGDCIMATREYCDFRNGFFHQKATLCSQVSCMEEVCGQIEFLDPDEPDQFYRLLTSIFLHAGLIQLVITVVYQLAIQRDLEKVVGWWRMAIIYLGSGAAGSLGSVIFIPYFVESGPGSAQFGVLGLMCVEVMRWNFDDEDDRPLLAMLKILALLVLLFFFGLIFPQVDNYAHLFGFLFGVLISTGLWAHKFEEVCNKPVRMCIRVVSAVVALLLAVGLFVMLVLIFYVADIYNCDNCWRFNCIPFSDDYCDGMQVELS